MEFHFDATFWAFVALAIFVAGALYLKVPAMVAGMLDQRSQEIAKELSEARRLREEAERLLADYTAKKNAAAAEADAMIAHAKEQAVLVAAETRKAAADAIARRQQQAEDRIAQAEASATADVRAAVADAAVAAAEKALREQMNAGAQSQLIDAGVEELKRKFA
ncbi:MAG: ATP F0F1 synthase subunit B [Caulobacterales bacterium]